MRPELAAAECNLPQVAADVRNPDPSSLVALGLFEGPMDEGLLVLSKYLVNYFWWKDEYRRRMASRWIGRQALEDGTADHVPVPAPCGAEAKR